MIFFFLRHKQQLVKSMKVFYSNLISEHTVCSVMLRVEFTMRMFLIDKSATGIIAAWSCIFFLSLEGMFILLKSCFFFNWLLYLCAVTFPLHRSHYANSVFIIQYYLAKAAECVIFLFKLIFVIKVERMMSRHRGALKHSFVFPFHN